MNAIILAAGLGSRLMPITTNTPKSLVVINGKPIIEIQIEYLLEIGITDITVVTGYLAEKFKYLKEKYNVNLVHNKYYHKYNNIYTMSLIIDKLKDSYVFDADVFMTRNFLIEKLDCSGYFSGVKDTKNEWELICSNDSVIGIKLSDGFASIMSGVSFWSQKDGDIIKNKLFDRIKEREEDWTDLYWDDIIKENLHLLDVKVIKISENDWFEIDTIDDYNNILKLYPNNTELEGVYE